MGEHEAQSQPAATAAPASTASERMQERFLEENLERLAIPWRSLEELRAVEPVGAVQVQSDGTPLLTVAGQQLDPPITVGLRRTTLRDLSAEQPVFVFGAGLGRLASFVTERVPWRVVVYEPDPGVLKTALSHGPSLLGAARLLCNLDDLAETPMPNAPAATVIVAPGYRDRYAKELAAFKEVALGLVTRGGVEANTVRVKGREWFECLVANGWALTRHPVVMSLEGKFPGVPAFIIGPGPSLSRNIELLGEARRKGILLAVNSSGHALAKQGLTPHVMLALESANFAHLFQLPFIDEVIRVFSLVSHPAIFSTGRGPLLPLFSTLREMEPVEQLLGRRGLHVAASVSTAAFSLAELLGCDPIVLVGHDLAYTGGRAYAAGTGVRNEHVEYKRSADGSFHLWHPDIRTKGVTQAVRLLDAWGGQGTVETGTVYGIILDWFAKRAGEREQGFRTGRYINATEGGGRIPGWEELTLRQVLDGLENRDLTVSDIMQRVPVDAVVSPEQLQAWTDEQVRLTRLARDSARELASSTERAQRAIELGHPGTVTRSLRALDNAERHMRQAMAASPMLDCWAMAAVDEAVGEGSGSASSGDDAAAALASLERELRVASAIAQAAEEFAELLARLPDSRPPA